MYKAKDKFGSYEIIKQDVIANVPLVSVVMAVFNGQATLNKAIKSVLSQTLSDIELIIVDDGSTDLTSKILEEFQALDNRVVLIKQPNVGLTISLNRALKVARGNYIARQDADDLSLPHRLEKQFETIISKNLDIVTSRAIKNGKVSPCGLILLHIDLETLTLGNVFIHGTFFCKSNIFKNLGYNANLRYAQDIDFIFRAIHYGYNIGYMQDPLYLLSVSEDSISYKKKTEQFKCFLKSANTYGNQNLLKLSSGIFMSNLIWFRFFIRVLFSFYRKVSKKEATVVLI
jgi:glycosyltransferase involved in cell wall biosynthesis